MRHVTLRQLRTFAQVVRSGSFAAASQALHLTPPAVTVQMRLLEERAGLPLLERTASGLMPTEAGHEIAAAALRIETVIGECAEALSALRGLKGGHVSIGVVSTAKYFAPQALGAFARTYPSVEIRLEVGNRAEIMAALAANTLDLALTGRPPEDLAVDKAPIGPHPHVIIAPPGHALAARRHLPVGSLDGETFLVRESGSGTRGLMDRFFADARVAPRIGMEMGSNETIKQAVMAGLGIAFLSAHTVAVEIEDGRLVMLDVTGLPVVRQWFIVRLARRRVLPAAQALREFLVHEGERFLPAPPRAGERGAPHARGVRRVAASAGTEGDSLSRMNEPMQIEVLDFIDGARQARGVAVVIDVFRAFSVACHAFARGVERIIPMADSAAALALRRAHPEYRAIGERFGRQLEGFDFGNSPTQIEGADLTGRTLVHTTHAGTQGLVNAGHADVILTGSLVNAGAVCAYIRQLAPRRVSIVRMGEGGTVRCAEDDLCAELLCARLRDQPFDTRTVRERLRAAPSAVKFFDPAAGWAPERDFELCTEVDRFGFVLRLATPAREEVAGAMRELRVAFPPAAQQ